MTLNEGPGEVNLTNRHADYRALDTEDVSNQISLVQISYQGELRSVAKGLLRVRLIPVCFFRLCPSTSAHAKVGRHPQICHPSTALRSGRDDKFEGGGSP